MVDLSSSTQSLHQQPWGFSEMGGGCYGAGPVPGGPTVLAAMMPPSRSVARPSWPPLDLHPPPAHQATDGFGRYGVYSLFPGDVYAAPRYAHTQPTAPSSQYHSLLPPSQKECVFSTYTPAPGSPYSAPVVERGISQLQELMAKSEEKKPPSQALERRPKRRAWEPPSVEVKQETRTSCACRAKTPSVSPGCSRTTPVILRPQVKREPTSTPCQVAEVTTSAVKVKQELPDPSPPHTVGGQTVQRIPVGIAKARQRAQETPRDKEDPVMPPLAPQLDQNLPLQPPVGYQLARDPVSGQFLLISTSTNLGLPDPLQRAIVWPNNTAASFPQSQLILPQTQPVTGHLLLDRLVTLATPTPPPQPTLDKRRPHSLIKIEEPSITGVMPCAKSSVVIQQLSTHSGSTPILPQQFSAIASSGSVLIQHISGSNSVQPTLIPQQNAGSMLISAQQLAAEPPQSLAGPSVVISHSQQDSSATVITPLVISGESFMRQPDPSLHLQIKESPKEEEVEGGHVAESEDQQVDAKNNSFSGCRSQGTSPAPCLSPAADCQSQSQSEDEAPPPGVGVADASNQTDSLPASDEETVGEELERVAPVDLSGLELLSTASIEQIERSHSVPLVETHRIKREVLDEVLVPCEIAPIENCYVKQESLSPQGGTNTEGGSVVMSLSSEGGGIVSGLGLLCDIAHRFIEQEAAASRPQSPDDNRKTPSGWSDAAYSPREPWSPEPGVRSRFRPDSPYDPAEQEMRDRMAELQKLYRQKQQELSRLTPRKSISSDSSSTSSSCAVAKRGPGRPRKEVKKTDQGSREDGPRGVKRQRSLSPSTPELSPPILEPWSADKCRSDGLVPPTLTPHKNKLEPQQAEWEPVPVSKSPPELSPSQSPTSASKKRKVGRPKKRVDHSSLTIVAKKSRSKGPFVGLLLAKKVMPTEGSLPCPNKIRPKLKAEVKIKSDSDEEDSAVWTTQPLKRYSAPSPPPARPVKSKSLPNPTSHKKPIMVLATRKRTVSTEQQQQKLPPQPLRGLTSCILTKDILSTINLPCCVLVLKNGLFHSGTLTAISPPDIYGLTIEGERTHRPTIHTQEDILKDTILEVRLDAIPQPGTRVCAYWSQQYRCLYPGTVSVQADDPGSRFVAVAFDDGDNGRINLDDIRLLPQNHPVVAYDPNPLQSLGKRRRRTSGTSSDSHLKSAQPLEAITEVLLPTPNTVMEEPSTSSTEPTTSESMPLELDPNVLYTSDLREQRRQKRKLKKKEKLRRLNGEKKHRHKHRDCVKSHRHKHKRRHKRKHRHSKSTVTEGGGHDDEGPPTLDLAVDPEQPSTSQTALVHTEQPSTSQQLIVHSELPSASQSTVVNTERPTTSKSGFDHTDQPSTGRAALPTTKLRKEKKSREQPPTVEPPSKMAAFLPAVQLWRWAGSSYKRQGKGRTRKDFYRSIQRGDDETISVGDCAVFLSTGLPDRPYIGRIVAMWETSSTSMMVKVKWFYHPEEIPDFPALETPGALFESISHFDENEVQTIAHKCEVLPFEMFMERMSSEPHRLTTIYDNNEIYYLAGDYNPSNRIVNYKPNATV